jgi:ABC-2 type transport system ATP-binding protein
VGANGAGKTTLLKMIAGLLHPSQGELKVLGHKPFERDRGFQKGIGMVMGQKSQLWIDIPASETYELLASLYEVPETLYKQRLQELAQVFRVEHLLNIQVRRLSLGERMKLEIIAALLHNPQLLILDEPTIGLDVVSKRAIRNFIREYNHNNKTTILLSSHDMTDISEVCERLVLVSSGKITFDGPVKEFETRQRSSQALRNREITFVFDINQDLSPEQVHSLIQKNQSSEQNTTLIQHDAGILKLRVPQNKISTVVSHVFQIQTPIDMHMATEDLESLVHEVMSG